MLHISLCDMKLCDIMYNEIKSSTYKATMKYVSTSIEPDVQASCYKQMVSRSPTKFIS